MSTPELKSELHQLIDSFEDEAALQRALDSLLALKTEDSPLLDDPSPETLERLRRGVEQAERGQTVSNDQFWQELKQWRSR